MILVGMSLYKVTFLRFNVLIAEEISSLVTFLKENALFLFVMCCFIVIMYAWVIIVIRNIIFTRLIIKKIFIKGRKNIKKIVIESFS